AGEVLPEGLLAQIYTRSAGVPLLVEEFSRMARESAMFESTGLPAHTGSPTRLNELPASLEDLVVARLDQMSCDRDVVQIAATIGREFDYSLLAAVVSVDEETLQRELSKLLRPAFFVRKVSLPHPFTLLNTFSSKKPCTMPPATRGGDNSSPSC